MKKRAGLYYVSRGIKWILLVVMTGGGEYGEARWTTTTGWLELFTIEAWLTSMVVMNVGEDRGVCVCGKWLDLV